MGRSLGFLEFEGSCYLEYLRGPCKDGEQLVMQEKRARCIKNSCGVGQSLWSDGECYEYQPSSKLTDEEWQLSGIEGVITTFTTFETFLAIFPEHQSESESESESGYTESQIEITQLI